MDLFNQEKDSVTSDLDNMMFYLNSLKTQVCIMKKIKNNKKFNQHEISLIRDWVEIWDDHYNESMEYINS